MKTFTPSDNSREVLRSPFGDRNDRNKSANSSDFGLSDGRQSNPGGTLFEKPGSRERETLVVH